jgi:uncharacterized membrane protein YfcA
MDSVVLVVAIGAVVAGFVQGLSGFAFGLTAMSFWVWSLDPKLAAVLVVFGSLTGQTIAAVAVRRGFNARTLWPFLIGGLLGIPLGVAVLPALDVPVFKACLGGFLALWCPVMLASRSLSKVAFGGRVADGVAGGLGGFMGGIGGFTGAVPTLWCTLRGMDKDEQRSIIQNFNLATLSVTMLSYIASGVVTRAMLPMMAVVVPAMLVPTLLGARLYAGISEATFRRIVLGLLALSGVAMLAASVPVLLQRLQA